MRRAENIFQPVTRTTDHGSMYVFEFYIKIPRKKENYLVLYMEGQLQGNRFYTLRYLG